MSRDPMEEDGGINLYCFVRNGPIDKWDYLGLDLGDCRRASSFTISIFEPDGSPLRAVGGRPEIDVTIKVKLDEDECECICESPRFAQEDRRSAWYWGIGWVSGPWTGDGHGGPAPGGGDYFNSAPSRPFRAEMWDRPGYDGDRGAAKIKIELYTRVVCTSGTEKDSTITSLSWGIDYNGTYKAIVGWVYDKNWWPSGPYPRKF